jgi:hypothetical protein
MIRTLETLGLGRSHRWSTPRGRRTVSGQRFGVDNCHWEFRRLVSDASLNRPAFNRNADLPALYIVAPHRRTWRASMGGTSFKTGTSFPRFTCD